MLAATSVAMSAWIDASKYAARRINPLNNEEKAAAPEDSIRFPVKKTTAQSPNEQKKRTAALKDPENLKTDAF